MRRITVFALVMTALFGARAARAETPSVAPPARFSIGAGVGFGSDAGLYGLGSASSYALAQSRSYAPFGTAVLELALSPQLRLGLGVAGSYARIKHRNDRDEDTDIPPTRTASVGTTLFARWVLNPGGIVEISPALAVGFRHGTMEDTASYGGQDESGEYVQYRADSESNGLEGRLGLVLEHALLPQLFLRFESYFVRAFYNVTDVVTDAPEGEETEHLAEAGFALALTPVVQLRLAF